MGVLELDAIDLDAGMRVAEQRLRHGFHHTRLARPVGPTLHPTFAVIEFRCTSRAVMQHRRWIGGISLRTTVAFVAAAILLMVTASQRAEAQTFTTLHSFSGLDGGMPTAGLTMDGAGNLYGTTQYGGTADYGSVFKLVHTGGSWILHPLYSFPNDGGGNDGAEPYAGVTIGPDGNLYGTTTRGGGSAAYGTVFKLSPPASVCRSTLCPWRETILHRFSGGAMGFFPTVRWCLTPPATSMAPRTSVVQALATRGLVAVSSSS
jgi:uncharacterized repeat protein (TIGR03803 family)